MRAVDEVAREYLDESLGESEPARLQDAAAMAMYVGVAMLNGATTITAVEYTAWSACLRNRVEFLFDGASSHRRAGLLYTLGYLGLRLPLTEEELFEAHESALAMPPWYDDPSKGLPDGFEVTERHFADLGATLSAWTELAKGLEDTPLFPLDYLSDHLLFLAPVLVDYPEWPTLREKVDEAIARVHGGAAVAERAQGMAMAFLRSGRRLEALEELHRVRIAGWSGNTVRGSLFAMLLMAGIYLELRLPQAAKGYSLAVGYAAAGSDDDELADIVPTALFRAAHADYVSGAWCNAVELTQLGFKAQHHLIEGGLDSFVNGVFESVLLQFTWISLCAQDIDPVLAESIRSTASEIGLQENIEAIIDGAQPTHDWVSIGTDDLTGPPFSDLGEERCIRFSGLGTEWTLHSASDNDSVIVAERFAAAAQVMLAALAREDLCILPTRINVRIEKIPPAESGSSESIKSLPSSDGRSWVVRLIPATTAGSADPEHMYRELLGMLLAIFFDVSLLPKADFDAVIERNLQRGLGHKLALARPYDELVAMVSDQQIERSRFNTPWDCLDGHYPTHDDLRWRDDPGPTFSKEKAEQFLKTRYRKLDHVLRRIVPYLRGVPAFRRTVETLRAEGWLDWHLLTAIHNIVVSCRIERIARRLGPENARRMLERVARSPEVETAEDIPARLFTHEAMNRHRQVAMLSLLKNWGLELHQTPDFPGIEALLGARYGYWDDDCEHIDPFPDGE